MSRASILLASSSPMNCSFAGSHRNLRFSRVAMSLSWHSGVGAVADFDRRRGILAAPHAVEEIAQVPGRPIAIRVFPVVGRQSALQFRLEGVRAGRNPAAVDEEAGFASLEADAHRNLVLAGVDHAHAVGIQILRMPGRGAIADSRGGKHAAARLDFDRLRVASASLPHWAMSRLWQPQPA